MEFFDMEYITKVGLREKILKVMVINNSSTALLYFMYMFYKMPDNWNYIYSVLPPACQKCQLIFILFSLIEAYWAVKATLFFFFNILITTLHVCSTQWWLKKVW